MKKIEIQHPGIYVRENIIPKGMTVKDAAKQLGIGRPALSSFLNGRSTLSPEMAIRLEKAFGADRKLLLQMQSAYDGSAAGEEEKFASVRAFVPSFLMIKAKEIEQWAATNIEARTHLPVLLRKLVHSTGRGLQKVDFPGYDNAQRKGSDGFIESAEATAWIPTGRSYWEFGTDRNVRSKADGDYEQRVRTVAASERANGTFVFVTPRNWHGKTDWQQRKNNEGEWKAVRVFDASDLEQWLEQSVPAQIWFAEQLPRPTTGYETLERVWKRFAEVSEPKLIPKLFEPAIASYRQKLQKWLEGPSERPFFVAADSWLEAGAFLACVFAEEALQGFKDLAAVFTSAETLRTVVESAVPFIPIVHTEVVEREVGGAISRLHCIVYRPRNAVDKEADIALDLLNYYTFKTALAEMGFDDDAIDRLGRESGFSPTILRRRLSVNAAIKEPEWAMDHQIARTIVPLALVGAWHAESEADREMMARIAGGNYQEIEVEVARLLNFDDCPVWSVGRYRGVTSKIDALFAIAKVMTPSDLDRFFIAAETVLSESDPALELPEGDRWAAALYGKKREYSSAVHEGICETLVILSIHGNNLFQRRLGVDIEGRVVGLIRRLLTPLTIEKLLSSAHDLPRYAEAAPDEFLNIIDEDLRRENPIIPGLLKPVEPGSLFSSPLRTGLLWALECLAFNPLHVTRVSKILGNLSQTKIDDNWMNKPEASLQAIFRSWMPQTAATVDQRVKALRTLIDNYPNVGWDICIEQIKPGSQLGYNSYRPRWRSDASGAGQVVTRKEMFDFIREVVAILFAWPSHDETTLGDLVECLRSMPEEDQGKVWDLIEGWSRAASDSSKAVLRERIRQIAFTRRNRDHRLQESTRDRAREIYDILEPSESVIRHIWLFESEWLQESIEEIQEDDYDFQKRSERVDRVRREAVSEIYDERGIEGILELFSRSAAAGTVGRYASARINSVGESIEFIQRCRSLEGVPSSKIDWFLRGFLSALSADLCASFLGAMVQRMSAEEFVRLLVCAPFQASTWDLFDSYGEDIRDIYWEQVLPSWGRYTRGELAELIDRLLAAGRPRAAFHTVFLDFKDVETARLKRLLLDVATVHTEPIDQYQIDRHYISEALTSLDGRPGISRDEMAQLEFYFIEALAHCPRGIPNLENQIFESPVLFAQAVAMAYKRKDCAVDPPELQLQDPEHQSAVATAAYRLLEQVRRIPGTDGSGRIDGKSLIAWLTEVRRICAVYGRSEVGDHWLGQLLAKAPEGKNGIWPCEEICEAMEEIASSEVSRGFQLYVRNSRGVHCRGEGGNQEREIASKYRNWADSLRFDYPYVGSVLEEIAASYDREAAWEDSRSKVDKRLNR